jgi:hypothetical protein
MSWWIPLGIIFFKVIKSIQMKAKIKILKTCSLGTMFFEKQKNPFQKDF